MTVLIQTIIRPMVSGHTSPTGLQWFDQISWRQHSRSSSYCSKLL